jgi:uncharacterized repeat protein (TIGR03803 family)
MTVRSVLKQTVLLLASLLLVVANAEAQSFSNLFVFNGTDGADPVAGLVLSSNTLYGTTSKGGTNGDGTVFAINTDGTGFTNLYEFSGIDGKNPYGPLVLSDNVLYGTTSGGGSTNGDGTVFAVNTDGTGFTNLFIFPFTTNGDTPDGYGPVAGLVLSGNTLYGTAVYGVPPDGTVFAVNTDGTGFTILHSGDTNGYHPQAGLVLSGSTLYGAMWLGGAYGGGTVFAVNTDETGYTNLYNFGLPFRSLATGGYTNAYGGEPTATLLLSGNTLFGTTSEGGTNGWGTVFKINTDGTGFTNLYMFGSGITGGSPDGALVLSGNTLYGTTDRNGAGTVYALNTDGTGFTNLVPVNGNLLGYYSAGGLVLSGHTLYGTQTAGGSFNGSVFTVTLPPPSMNIQLINGAAALSWNDPTSTYSLQAAPNVSGVYTNLTGATSPYTNVMNGSQVFFRLQSN